MSRLPTDDELAVLLERAIELALANVEAGAEPFGALVWREGEVLAEGVNSVQADLDPTAHAETAAVRAAARATGSPWLTGAVVLASGEPCVQCLASSAAADVAHVYFAGPKSLVPRLEGPDRPHLSALQDALKAVWPAVTHVPHPRAAEPFEAFLARRAAEG